MTPRLLFPALTSTGRFARPTLTVAALLLLPALAPAQEVRPHAGMLRFPAVSRDRIAFVYAGKVWLSPRDGGLASPAAAPLGAALNPRFSPDGKTLAFTGNYDGNGDLYTISVDGGIPHRVTHHPGTDRLCGWTPDGRLLYSNNLMDGQPRYSKLLTVPPAGGMPTPLPVPYGEDAAISPDGRWLAYTPSSTNDRTWKRYRGGWAQDLWLFDLQTKQAKKITDWEGTDTLPMWNGDRIFYLSDAGPEHRLNVWVYETRTGKRRQVTKFADNDVKWPSIGPDAIVFQHGSALRLLDLKTEQSKVVEVRIPGDRIPVRAQTLDAAKGIESWSLAPSAKRVAVSARGDIWTLPAKDGSPRNLTRTSGAREKDATWSPDGKAIAYLSDVTGEYELYVVAADGRDKPRRLTTDGAKYRMLRGWSPDSKQILLADSTGAHTLVTVDTAKATPVDKDPGGRPLDMVFSPDSRWIAYSRTEADPRSQPAIWIYSVETGQKRKVTSGVFADTNPAFDRKGEWLVFVSSRIFRQPIYDDNQTTWIYPSTQTLVALPLRPQVASPFLPKSDEEPATQKPEEPKKTQIGLFASAPSAPAAQADPVSGDWNGTVTNTPVGDVTLKVVLRLSGTAITGSAEAIGVGTASVNGTFTPGSGEVAINLVIPNGPTLAFRGKIENGRLSAMSADGMTMTLARQGGGGAAAAPPATGAAAKTEPAKPVTVEIDFDGLEARAIALPVAPGSFGSPGFNAQNQLLFIRRSSPNVPQPAGLKLLDFNDPKREEKMVAAGAPGYDITPDGSKLLIPAGTGASIQNATAGASGEPVPTGGMSVSVDPRAEWAQILAEAWRIERDFFYDPNMHGVDWPAVRKQYEAMLPDASDRNDVGYLIEEMISELNVGHAYYGDPNENAGAPTVGVGSLGCDFALENGAYRIARILRAAPWDTDVASPLAQPGLKVREGDYLLAVNGVPVDPARDPWASLIDLTGKSVTLTVSAKPTLDSEAREIVVRPISTGAEIALRYRAWIEHNRAYVEKASGGKVGYIYVPDTGVNGQSDLLRQFVGQTSKEALIIDDRWNGGGQIPTRFIELLNRPLTNLWALRDGVDWVWPPDSHFGPKCMLINGLAGSGGDAFPYYFRQAGLGKLIGTRTWGGLVGISGGPSLVDGARVTSPNFAFYEKDGTWGVEGHGVDPDIEVIDDPSKMQNGEDPQLDAAIAQMLKEIKEKPFVLPKRPPYANRRGMGIPQKDR